MADLITDYKELEFPDGVSSPLLSVTYNNDGTVSFTDITNYKNKDDTRCVYINADLINLTNTEINSLASRYTAWLPDSYTPLDTNLVNAQFNVKKFQMTDIGNDEVTLTDRTVYSTVGSTYNADKINAANIILMNLQSGYNQHVNGTNGILTFLHANGASSDNLITALSEMETSQLNKVGFEEGIQQAIINPHGNDCYTNAELTALTEQNASLRTKFSDTISGLDNEYDFLLRSQRAFADAMNNTQNYLNNNLIGGIDISTAYLIANESVSQGDDARAGGASVVQNYSSTCSYYVNYLG